MRNYIYFTELTAQWMDVHLNLSEKTVLIVLTGRSRHYREASETNGLRFVYVSKEILQNTFGCEDGLM